ncbi:hypothetical protein [Marinobacter orientalis]|uniref:Uncharacterized protein n=1 Tax=Marinobacter orientalis TaxID=1928859 RepID=A0A7Y0R9I5_9GAMM|nr:hypothetical protein [Marinobacter orientalis]NMT62565.1 hypothetical protein [Marinobacter orientalis]TGX51258.1 hypothetical protein DIT72_04300 [Marinobacter orientalis]
MNRHNCLWWAGVADVLTNGLAHGALKLERVHLSVADETFNILQRVPVTRPVGEATRFLHHTIARVSYRSVAAVSAGLGMLARTGSSPAPPYCTFSSSPNRSENSAEDR